MILFAHNGEVHETVSEAAAHQATSPLKMVIMVTVVTAVFVAGLFLLSRLFGKPIKQEDEGKQ